MTLSKQANQTRILKLNEVVEQLRISRSSLYLKMNEQTFPPPISLGERSVGFIALEVDRTLRAMIQGATKEQLQTLVTLMISERASEEVSL